MSVIFRPAQLRADISLDVLFSLCEWLSAKEDKKEAEQHKGRNLGL
jgi:hypothetical protein